MQVLQRMGNCTMIKPECRENPQRRQSSMQQCCAKRAQEDKDQLKSITTLSREIYAAKERNSKHINK